MNYTTMSYAELKDQERICTDAISIHRQALEKQQEHLRAIRAQVEIAKQREEQQKRNTREGR
jgi:hypothetical protein